jgi:hypothetical protein
MEKLIVELIVAIIAVISGVVARFAVPALNRLTASKEWLLAEDIASTVVTAMEQLKRQDSGYSNEYIKSEAMALLDKLLEARNITITHESRDALIESAVNFLPHSS